MEIRQIELENLKIKDTLSGCPKTTIISRSFFQFENWRSLSQQDKSLQTARSYY